MSVAENADRIDSKRFYITFEVINLFISIFVTQCKDSLKRHWIKGENSSSRNTNIENNLSYRREDFYI